MRTCDYSDVLRGSAALAGFTMDDLGGPEFALFRTFHDRRLQLAWEIHRWPDLCRIEQRAFRAAYDVTGATTYAATTEVLDVATLQYFQALQTSTGKAPTINAQENSAYWALCKGSYQAYDWETGTDYPVGGQVRHPADNNVYQCITAHTSGGSWDATKWGVLTPFNRYIAYNQAGQTALGEVLFAFDRDPRVTTKLCPLPYTLSADGVQFATLRHTLAYVWLQYRIQRPLLTGDAFDSTVVYASGQQMYYKASTGLGNFYTAVVTTTAGDTPESAPAKWSVVALPYIFRQYLMAAGYADWLTSDGQADKAGPMEQMATSCLELEADKLQRQQGQVNRMQFRS